ncbi:MAG TPA: RNA 2',3'-cyclic phosphodiesterase [Gammaproteobacteria bacterium]|nr:RNA 2',3'-cyclic phosphodiesterase [Gammaproteobacteria bacterium]
MATRRLFFALWPDDAVREALRRETRHAVRRSGGRPVPVANLHLTLRFLGNVAAERVEAVFAVAAGITGIAATSLQLDRYGWFPQARVFWLGTDTVPAPLAALAGRLEAGLVAAGFEPEPRPFQAHVTLARKVARAPAVEPPHPVTWPVYDFALIESHTARRGACYEVVGRWPLAGAPAVARESDTV